MVIILTFCVFINFGFTDDTKWNIEVLKLLLKKGGNPNVRISNKMVPKEMNNILRGKFFLLF